MSNEIECPSCRVGTLYVVSELGKPEVDQILICTNCEAVHDAIYTTYVGEINS